MLFNLCHSIRWRCIATQAQPLTHLGVTADHTVIDVAKIAGGIISGMKTPSLLTSTPTRPEPPKAAEHAAFAFGKRLAIHLKGISIPISIFRRGNDGKRNV